MREGGAWAGEDDFMGKDLRKEEEWKQLGWQGCNDRPVIKAPTNKRSVAH